MKRIFYTILITLFLTSVGNTSNLEELKHQRINILNNIHSTEECYFNQTQKLCNLLNINENQHYLFELLNIAYTNNNNNEYKQINSTSELFQENQFMRYPIDLGHEVVQTIYNILVSQDNPMIINNINEIFKTRKKIYNLRKLLDDLENETIKQTLKIKHVKHNKL